jgi:hypothetical protein
MKRLFLTAATIAALSLAACETATPYQPAPPGRDAYGYSDYKVDASHWRVSFSGNSLTSRETVEKYLLYRAAQLTVEQGYDWFQPTQRNTERNTSYYGNDPYWSTWGWGWRPYWGFGGPWGWRSWGFWGAGPYWPGDLDIQQVNRYEASAEIVMGKGPAPSDHRVFDAHQVMQNLGPQVVKPPQS